VTSSEEQQQEAQVPGSILAVSTSDNAPGGAVLTFAFPIILFAVIAVVLYLLFSRPHRRVPAKRVALAAAAAGGAPEPAAAHGAAVATGMPTASGGGSTESAAEPAGAKRDIMPAEAAGDGTGKVSGGAGSPATASEQDKTEGTEASE
jgi:hypothetical protein